MPVHKEEAHKMAELDVPVIKKGTFNQLQISDLSQLAQDTVKAMPYLLEAQREGKYRGDKNSRFNTEPIPPFLHLRHYPNDIALTKLKEWAAGVDMELDSRLVNGEDWGFVKFTNVDPELAKLLSVSFPYRSAEFLPNFENPDTGEVYPVVLRSVAFLDANTEPAVPQYPGYSVKLAQDGLGVQTVRCDVPTINHQHKETDIMADHVEASPVKLSQEDLQRFAAMEDRLKALEEEKTTLKGVVNEMKATNDALSSDVLKFQQEAKVNQTDAFCLKLEKDYHLTPAAIQAIRPVIAADNGVVKLSEETDPIPVDQAYRQSLEAVLKLAREKDALFVPEQGILPTGKVTEKILTRKEQIDAAIIKLEADAKESGEPFDYADARMRLVKTDNTILDEITKSAGKEAE